MSIESKRDHDRPDIMVIERTQADELRELETVRQGAQEASTRGNKQVPDWARWVGKWLIIVYRLHLGWLMGHRFLLVTHRGRRTGKCGKPA